MCKISKKVKEAAFCLCLNAKGKNLYPIWHSQIFEGIKKKDRKVKTVIYDSIKKRSKGSPRLKSIERDVVAKQIIQWRILRRDENEKRRRNGNLLLLNNNKTFW